MTLKLPRLLVENLFDLLQLYRLSVEFFVGERVGLPEHGLLLVLHQVNGYDLVTFLAGIRVVQDDARGKADDADPALSASRPLASGAVSVVLILYEGDAIRLPELRRAAILGFLVER